MVNKRLSLYLFLFTLIFHGCSTNLKSTVSLSALTVETPNCGNSTCRIKTEYSVYYTKPPETISLKVSENGFDVVCYAEGGAPENLAVDAKVDFVSHPLSCPELNEEKVLNEKYLVKKVELEKKANEEVLKTQTEPLNNEEDLALLKQLEELFEQGLISEIVYKKEKALIENKTQE